MNPFKCILIGNEIINKIIMCEKSWGYVDGFVKDDVLGVLSVDLGKEKMDICQASILLFKHRYAKGNYKEKLAYWIKADIELVEKINRFEISYEELAINFPEELVTNIKQSKCEYILVIGKKTSEVALAWHITIGDKKLIIPGEVQLLDEVPNPFKRVDGIVPLEAMKTKNAVIVGVGSGGSFVAMELASAGVGTLHLFDKDRLNSTNLFRHLCDSRDLGRLKVDAVGDVIKEHILPVTVKKCSDDILDSPEELIEAINFADIVICTTDNTESREMVNYLCVKQKKVLILACTYDNARIGEIIRVIPNKTACYECTRLHLKEMGVLSNDDENKAEILPYSSQTIDGENKSRGMRTDVIEVAAITARVSLMTLCDDIEDGFGKLNYNYITWGAVRNTEFMEPFRFEQPFQTKSCNFNIHPQCPVCGALPKEMNDINVEEKYNEIMQKLLSK